LAQGCTMTSLPASGVDCQQILQLPVVDFGVNYFPLYKQNIENSGARPATVVLRPPECKGFEMNSDKHTSHEPLPSAGELSSNRRNLLKAAASMAPFVGTLPSGAALANASSVQCALFLQGEAAEPRPNPATTSMDNYYRVAAKQWITSFPPLFEPATVYQFTALGTSTVVRVDANGNNLTIPPTNPNPPSGAVDVYLLILYVPLDDPLTQLSLEDDGVTPASCNIASGKGFPDGTPVAPGTYCIHPIARLEGGANGNMGMTASCLTSFVAG